MKTILRAVAIVITVLFTVNVSSQNSDSLKVIEHDSICLEISGRIYGYSHPHDNIYKVELIENNAVVVSETKKDKSAFRFNLKKDTYYAIKIYKKGFAPKLISICTKIPHEKYNNSFYHFSFKLEMIAKDEFEKLDKDSRDFPIAIVSFNTDKKGFDYNEKYTSNIKRSLLSSVLSGSESN